MPFKKFCNASGCSAIISNDEIYCELHKKKKKQDQKYYDQKIRNKEAKAFYDSTAWHNTRKKILARDGGIDVYIYITEKRIVPAQHVHHIEPREENKSNQYDPMNLISLAHSTHSMIEKRYRAGEKEKKEAQNELKRCLAEYIKTCG